MAIILTPHDKWQSFTCDCVWQNGVQIVGSCEGVCNIPTGYLTGRKLPNYPVPAIDYYNSGHPNHVAIGNCMEWSIPVAIQLHLRS